MRTAAELYDGDSSSETTNTEPVREAQSSEVVTPKVETTEKVEVKPAEQIAKPVEQTEDESQDVHVPDDLEGLKKALSASRGDKRKERKKWQETERQLAELKGRLAVYQQHVAQPKVEPMAPKMPEVPDLNESNFFDPNEQKKYIDYQRVTLKQELDRQFQDRSERAARKRHEDFDSVVNEFVTAAKNNPNLWKQFAEDDDPGEYAYQIGKQLKDFQGVSSIADYEAKIEARVRAKIAAESNQQPTPTQQVAAPQMPKPPLPKSIASVRGTGLGVKPEWSPHTPEQLYDS